MQQTRPALTIVSYLLAAVAFTAITPAFAVVLEEVVVTAQKREQQLSDVGISVTAFSGKQMRELGVSTTQEIDNQTPGLIVTDFGSGATTVFTIRGAGQLDFNDQQEAPGAVYIDGAYNSYLAGVGFNFYDLERIEVLRGSQGTLFGRNATAGLVHIISAKPTDEFEGYVEVSVGEYDEFKAEGAISGPLTDSLKGRLSLFHEINDGYVENTLGSDSHDIDNISGRAQLLFEPSDQLSVLIAGRWSEDDATADIYDIRRAVTDVGGIAGLPGDGFVKFVDAPTHFDYCTNSGPAILGFISNPVLGAADCSGNFNDDGPFKASANLDGFYKREHYGITGTIDYEIGIGTVTSITDWQDFEKRYLEDSDSGPQTLFHFFQDMDSDQFSQEVRLAGEHGRLRWLIGGYFLNIDSSGRSGLDSVGSLGISFDNRYSLETTTYAAFTQLEYEFTPQFSGIAGFRWTEDEKEFEILPGCTFLPDLAGINAADCALAFAGTGFIQGDGLPKTKRDEGDWSGHVELDWRPNDEWLVYAKVSRGHKAGGFNGGIISFFLADAVTYDSELPITYEGGFKADLFDGKARLNTAVFYTDYNDFQTFTQTGPNLILFNVDAEVLGAEIELVANPWDGWEFLFGLSLLDGEQQDLEGPDGFRDRPMPNAPDVSFNALGRYEWAAFGGMMAAQLDMNYVDDRSLNGVDHPALQGESYTIANGHIQWTSGAERWQIRFWAKNFTDETYFHTTFDITGITGVTQPVVGSPRWVGGTVSYRW